MRSSESGAADTPSTVAEQDERTDSEADDERLRAAGFVTPLRRCPPRDFGQR